MNLKYRRKLGVIEVEIQNFQSIRKAFLKVDGFTGIQGRSNIGKSAIVRAIRCALTGAAGQDFVRHGDTCERKTKGLKKCKCQSTVRLQSPQWKLIWEKGDSVNRYIFQKDGGLEKVYDSVSRGTPDFLLPDFEPIKVGDSSELLQVIGQFNPIFLLDQSGPAVADVLSDVAKLDNINLAMTLVNRDRKEAVSTQKVREKDIQSLLRVLEAYKDLDSVTSNVIKIRDSYRVMEEKESGVQKLERFIRDVQDSLLQIKFLDTAIGPSLPDEVILENRFDSYGLLKGFCARATELMGVIKTLSGVTEVDSLDSQNLEGRARKCQEVFGLQLRAEILDSEIAPILKVAPIGLPEGSSLKEPCSKAGKLNSLHSRLEILSSEVRPLSEVDSQRLPSFDFKGPLEKLRRLESWLEQVWRIKQDLHGERAIEAPLPVIVDLERSLRYLALLESAVAVEGELGVLERELEESEEGVQKVLEDFEKLGICPTCSQPVQAGRCLGVH